jgi:hypothetical protein
MIKVYYQSVDHCRKTRSFKTLAGAQKFAQAWVGETPELGTFYAVSADGVGKVTVSGASLKALFPKLDTPKDVGLDEARKLVGQGKYAIIINFPRYDGRDAICGWSRSVHGIYDTADALGLAIDKLADLNEYAEYWTPPSTAPQAHQADAADDIPF